MSTLTLRPLKLRSLKFLFPLTKQPKRGDQEEFSKPRSQLPIYTSHRWQLEQAERYRKLQLIHALERRCFF
ncbi:MAG: hypothetical protein AAF215_22405 [Cyanobacteria bacterium P01_A01_bin.123]